MASSEETPLLTSNHNTKKLEGVHPDLASKVLQVLKAMDGFGHPMIITDGVRTKEQQMQLYAQGRTAPGKIVTNNDGVVNPSNHQPHADGLGHAVDCCFLVDNQPSWDPSLPWSVYGAAVQHLGLTWGGSWKHFKDLPHVELP